MVYVRVSGFFYFACACARVHCWRCGWFGFFFLYRLAFFPATRLVCSFHFSLESGSVSLSMTVNDLRIYVYVWKCVRACARTQIMSVTLLLFLLVQPLPYLKMKHAKPKHSPSHLCVYAAVRSTNMLISHTKSSKSNVKPLLRKKKVCFFFFF